jgi:hypothetical protein
VFNNTGTVEVDSGTLILSGGGTDVGATYKGAGTVNFNGDMRTLDSTSNIAGNATFSGSSQTQTTVNGSTNIGLMTVSGGTATFNGTVTTGSLTQDGGELNGSGTVTVTGAGSFASGTESGTGTTVVQGGASFAVNGFGIGLDGGRTLELGGTSTVKAFGVTIDLNATNPNTGNSDPNSGTLTIMPGATFKDESTGNFTIKATNQGGTDTGATAAVNNYGTYIKDVTSSQSMITTLFNNTGTVDVQSGTLKLAGAVTNTGLLKADGGTLLVAGAVNGASGEISGSSVLEFGAPSNVNITFDPGSTGRLKVDGSVGYGGTISGLALGNYVDLTNVQYFGSTFQPIYVANSTNTGGTLEVVTSVTQVAGGGVEIGYGLLLNLSDPTGSYSANSFVESSDGSGGALITDPPVASVSNVITASSTPSGQSGTPNTVAALTSPISVADSSTVEINLPYTGQVNFEGPIGTGTLQLDNSANFSGTVAGMIGQDTLDLRDIDFVAIQKAAFSGSETSGTLSVGDGVHTANIQLLGNYIAAAFTTASDGHGGTFVETQLHPVATLSASHA